MSYGLGSFFLSLSSLLGCLLGWLSGWLLDGLLGGLGGLLWCGFLWCGSGYNIKVGKLI